MTITRRAFVSDSPASEAGRRIRRLLDRAPYGRRNGVGTSVPPRESALESLAASAAANIPGADFVSISVRSQDGPLRTVASTDPLAEQADMLQYELREGPCYAAVTKERFVLVNDLADSMTFPDYGPKAVALGIGAQAGIQLLHQKETAGLNLYARTAGAFDRSTVQLAELFATQAGALLGYADQVEQLSVALHTRTDIGTAVGIFMERYHLDRHKAFAFLARCSQNRNIKVRILARQVIDGTFKSTPAKISPHANGPDRQPPMSHHWRPVPTSLSPFGAEPATCSTGGDGAPTS